MLRFETFEADRAEFQNRGNMVRSFKTHRGNRDQQCTLLRAWINLTFASSTVTHVPSVPTNSTRDVKAVFRQQLVEVIAGNAARNGWEPRAYQSAY